MLKDSMLVAGNSTLTVVCILQARMHSQQSALCRQGHIHSSSGGAEKAAVGGNFPAPPGGAVVLPLKMPAPEIHTAAILQARLRAFLCLYILQARLCSNMALEMQGHQQLVQEEHDTEITLIIQVRLHPQWTYVFCRQRHSQRH